MVREHVITITEEAYEKLHYCREDDEDQVDESEENDVGEEAIVGEDDEEETLFANELDGAMQFLSKAWRDLVYFILSSFSSISFRFLCSFLKRIK